MLYEITRSCWRQIMWSENKSQCTELMWFHFSVTKERDEEANKYLIS